MGQRDETVVPLQPTAPVADEQVQENHGKRKWCKRGGRCRGRALRCISCTLFLATLVSLVVFAGLVFRPAREVSLLPFEARVFKVCAGWTDGVLVHADYPANEYLSVYKFAHKPELLEKPVAHTVHETLTLQSAPYAPKFLLKSYQLTENSELKLTYNSSAPVLVSLLKGEHELHAFLSGRHHERTQNKTLVFSGLSYTALEEDSYTIVFEQADNTTTGDIQINTQIDFLVRVYDLSNAVETCAVGSGDACFLSFGHHGRRHHGHDEKEKRHSKKEKEEHEHRHKEEKEKDHQEKEDNKEQKEDNKDQKEDHKEEKDNNQISKDHNDKDRKHHKDRKNKRGYVVVTVSGNAPSAVSVNYKVIPRKDRFLKISGGLFGAWILVKVISKLLRYRAKKLRRQARNPQAANACESRCAFTRFFSRFCRKNEACNNAEGKKTCFFARFFCRKPIGHPTVQYAPLINSTEIDTTPEINNNNQQQVPAFYPNSYPIYYAVPTQPTSV